MNGKVWGYFEKARELAIAKQDNKSFILGAVGIRRDGAVVYAVNSISQEPNRLLHCEYRICRKIDQGSTIYLVRVRLLNGEYAMSKPCPDCEKVLKSRRVKRVYYTISNNEYGVLEL